MLISSDNLFAGMSISRGKSTVKKEFSDLESGEELISFDSLLREGIPGQVLPVGKETKRLVFDLAKENQTIDSTDENQTTNHSDEVAVLLSRVDDGIETGIRLSLPGFIKDGTEGKSASSLAFVSAETEAVVEADQGFSAENPNAENSGLTPFSTGKERKNDISKNMFAFSLSLDSDDKNDRTNTVKPVSKGSISGDFSVSAQGRDFQLPQTEISATEDPVSSGDVILVSDGLSFAKERMGLSGGVTRKEDSKENPSKGEAISVHNIIDIDIEDPSPASSFIMEDALNGSDSRITNDTVAGDRETVSLKNMESASDMPAFLEQNRSNSSKADVENGNSSAAGGVPEYGTSDQRDEGGAENSDSLSNSDTRFENPTVFSDSVLSLKTEHLKVPGSSLQLQKGPAALSDGVANVIKITNYEGKTRAQVIVDPPAVGKIHVEIHATPEGVEANLRVENVAIKDMIRTQLPLLQDMLAQQGISLSGMNVDVHSGDEGKKQWAGKSSGRRNSDSEEMEAEVAARIDLEQGLLVWTA